MHIDKIKSIQGTIIEDLEKKNTRAIQGPSTFTLLAIPIFKSIRAGDM
jgi:hypothetical protein